MISFMEGLAEPQTGQSKPLAFAHFEGMAWPLAGRRCDEIEWKLRYGPEESVELTREDMLVAASILAAYRQMVWDPREKRDRVIRELRKGSETKETPTP